jgi:hypothetical protein
VGPAAGGIAVEQVTTRTGGRHGRAAGPSPRGSRVDASHRQVCSGGQPSLDVVAGTVGLPRHLQFSGWPPARLAARVT